MKKTEKKGKKLIKYTKKDEKKFVLKYLTFIKKEKKNYEINIFIVTNETCTRV